MDYTCILERLVKAEKAKEIDRVIEDYEVFHDSDNWEYYGGIEKNFSTIMNQSRDSKRALVEKIVNSIDAIATNAAKVQRIDPEGPDVPQTPEEAAELFWNIPNGDLAAVDTKRQRELAQDINLIATGQKSNPCLIVYDRGEGQKPEDFPDTFLSLFAKNKDKVPFVQGKFNMGSSGVLRSCKNGYQLILSRKNPALVSPEKENPWGFTLVRERDPAPGEELSVFEYFAPQGEVPTVNVDKLKLLPGTETGEYNREMEFGTFVKMYEYDIALGSNIILELNYHLSRMLFKLTHPVRIIENRNFGSHYKETTLLGMDTRLETTPKRQELLEPDFPIGRTINVEGIGRINVKMWLFKEIEDKPLSRFLKPSEAIIFTVNGISHDIYPNRFFDRKAIKKDSIKKHLMVHVDCSQIPKQTLNTLFMPSRDGMYRSYANKLEGELEKLFKNDEVLKKWNEKRKNERIGKNIHDNQATKDLLNKIATQSPEVLKLFNPGIDIPYAGYKGSNQEDKPPFELKKFPTFLELTGVKNGVKNCPENSYCRLTFNLNAENDYFSRSIEPGELYVYPDKMFKSSSLSNGKLSIDLQPSLMNLKEGDKSEIKVRVTTPSVPEGELKEELTLNITKAQKKRKNPGGEKKNNPAKLTIPQIDFVSKENWPGETDNETAIKINNDDSGLSIMIYEDNVYLKSYLQQREKDKAEVIAAKEKFKLGVGLLGLAIYNKLEEADDKELDEIGKGLSQVILPIVDNLDKVIGA